MKTLKTPAERFERKINEGALASRANARGKHIALEATSSTMKTRALRQMGRGIAKHAIVLGLAVGLAGCSSWYETRTYTIPLPSPPGMKATGEPPAQITMFEKWTSLWSAVCGATISYSNGVPQQTIPGNCGTPLTLLMGFTGPATAGLGAAVWSAH